MGGGGGGRALCGISYLDLPLRLVHFQLNIFMDNLFLLMHTTNMGDLD